MVEAFFALLGAVVAAVVTAVFGLWRDARRKALERVEARRTELVDLVARFIRGADSAWAAEQLLGAAIVEIQSDLDSDVGWSWRSEALADRRRGVDEAMHAIGVMRLLYPGVAEPAAALLATQGQYSPERHAEAREAREGAMLDLVGAARELLDKKGRPY